jgi:hypothetical protein
MFSTIEPGEDVVLTFMFRDGLDIDETILSATVIVTTTAGVDVYAATHFKAPQINLKYVLVGVSGCIANVNYHVKVVAITSNPSKILVLAKTLPCRVA